MSHGAGLVRTTCSSGSALGPGAGAAQPSASPLEGLLDPSYPRTHAALLKVAQMVTLLIAFICVLRSASWTNYSAYSYFEVVTICDLIMILAFYLVHLFRFYRVLTCISWPLSELLHYLIGTLLLLIASIVAASKSYNQSGLVAGAIFGFMATFLCMASIWLSYKISCVTQSTDWVLPCCPGWCSDAIRAHCSLCLPGSSDPSTSASCSCLMRAQPLGPSGALQRGRVLQARPVDLCSRAKVLSGWWEPGKACPLFLLSPEASSQSS